jgi:hypothetical protein
LRACFDRPFLSEESEKVEIREEAALNAVKLVLAGTFYDAILVV